jgi:hypothetical protein
MPEEITFFDMVRLVLIWTSPLIFMNGLLLFFTTPEAYTKIENILDKEIGGLRKKIMPRLETNIESFHVWLLTRKRTVGLICVVLSISIFLLLAK